ncbi:hypothetical protein COV05_00240 [Candidatus Uhrbacteria bacterium CG10_big_fil_rev_8_21_14_0_10_48_16]|uniref:Regulator of chromosome condensation n=1 Tax=Candidatus Uhrbacteria bacterium CG10_big_fil_rev_8_21_14_0_10_48_16 TaxID=1975038 RepID=A0A2M8LIK5_9BACT|nr:MAG: hypothetical protein COV05_00240 [Candidatus Uhrbacteria bacterium CG10_big_fil_rev_8_21_14_0_10_48_16]
MRSILPLGLLTALLCAPACAPDITVVENRGPTPDAPVSPDADNDGWTVENGDCNDADASINPGAVEICDGIDNDCSGEPDDVEDNTWYYDGDFDSYGGELAVVDGCDLESEGPGQWVAMTGDCDDTDASVNPSAEEVCNGIDDDCEGTIDENATDASTWYFDGDSDNVGGEESEEACEAPEDYVAETGDCDDYNPLVNPGATEVCDGLDNDCDSVVDETDGNPDVLILWDDDDADGYGDDNAGSFTACPADGFVEQGGDCDDTDPAISPDADEVCDGLDNDCDGSTDPDDSLDVLTWYADADGDGWGECLEDTDACTSTLACDQPVGYVDMMGDCNDADVSVNPGATEVCDDIDNDCDGVIDPSTSTDAGTWYPDSDGDNFGNASGTTVTQCDQPESYVADATDCDDGDSSSFPGADEYCDGADNDCDGVTDPDSSVDAIDWYNDVDTDGYGGASAGTSCSAPSGTVADATDCDDTDSSVYPGATEYCDTQDNDCDGDIDEEAGDTYYADLDGDGYGDPDAPQEDCSDPDGYVEDASDCDDTNEFVSPAGIEVCSDSADNDCDGDADSSPCVTEGDYSGNFSITLTETTYGLGSDNCEGDAYLTVDTTASPMISGYVECEFVGDAGTYLSGTYTGTVEGDFAQDISTAGTIDWSTFGWTLNFAGVYDVDHEVNLDFEGSDTYEVYGIPVSFDYTGYVDTDVVP